MNMVEPLETSSDPGSGGVAAVGLGCLILLFLMYDHFERKFRILNDHTIETQARFLITEDKLGTLEDLEEDIRGLKEAEDERKNSWEDDVIEPGKFQAILGKAEQNIEIRIYNESLNTFKSNRYWILNNTISNSFLSFLIDENIFGGINNFRVSGDRIVAQKKILTGVDSIMCVEYSVPNTWGNPFIANEGTMRSLREKILSVNPKNITWKRALIDCPADS